MKKILATLLIFAIGLPSLAIVETGISKSEYKYQKKLEKIRQKQEIDKIKHPEKYIQSPVKQTTMTLGTAQKTIKLGTSQADVAEVLGAPNIVTTDADGKETWIYDKVSTVQSYNSNGFQVGDGGIGGGYGNSAGGGGILGVGYGKSSGTAQTSQKTLTIVIKFQNQKVASFKYHMSNF